MTFHDTRAGCMGKIAYHSPQAAHVALKKLTPTIFRRTWGKPFVKAEPQEVYRCRTCSKWHLGRSQ